MSAVIDQKAYLQKYLGGASADKKKKKKKVTKGKGFKIIDDDIDLTKLRPLEGDELDILGEGEDAPQVAGIIDERPEEIKKLEQFKSSSKWRVINQDDGFNSKLQIEEIKRDHKEVEKENELVFGKMYSDSEDEKKNDSDPSPPRKQAKGLSTKEPQNNSDSDFSPPRKNREASPKRSRESTGNNVSRKHEGEKSKERVRKPSRWGDFESTESKPRNKSNSPKRSSKHKASPSPHRKIKRKSPDSDVSPPRRSHSSKKKNYDSDASPPRKSRKTSPKKRNVSPDSDLSPPRKNRQSFDKNKSDRSNNRHKKTDSRKDSKSSDSDLSPPRKNRRQKSPSPQRKSRKQSPERNQKRKHDSDSDQSPPRREKERYKKDERRKRNSDSPPPSNKKMAKTLKGKRETSEERRNQKEKAERQKELDEKYKKWSKGLKQIEAQEERLQEYLHEAAKPLARHKGDQDLETRLKDVERDGDPMLQYIREKKREKGELGPEKPVYKGNFPPNRFNIRPGYRWDGVDRSNGYEKKYFDQKSKSKAQEEEAYKWSTEDL